MRRIVGIAALLLLVATACDQPFSYYFGDRFTDDGYVVAHVAVGPGTEYPLTHSWRPGCPVGPEDLLALEFRHHTYDGGVADGVLIVHHDVAPGVVKVLADMWLGGFPLHSAKVIDEFGGSDDASMAADNSSAFNCRVVAGTRIWSQHAYGRAIDLNPVRNPYVSGSFVAPPGGARYVDRSLGEPGMITEGDVVVTAFDSIGWGWGGRWSTKKDYQHFSSTGR